MDKNQDGVISEEEFLQGCEKVRTQSSPNYSVYPLNDKDMSICIYNAVSSGEGIVGSSSK